jgi:hypothetical protein
MGKINFFFSFYVAVYFVNKKVINENKSENKIFKKMQTETNLKEKINPTFYSPPVYP